MQSKVGVQALTFEERKVMSTFKKIAKVLTLSICSIFLMSNTVLAQKDLKELMPSVEHEPSVYVDGSTVTAFGVNVITPDGVFFAKDGIELYLKDAGSSSENNRTALTEENIKNTMDSSYQGPSIVVRNGHLFGFGVKITAQRGAVVYAGKGTEIGALDGSIVHAMLGSVVFASKNSTVIANAGSTVQGLKDSKITAKWGAYVIADYESEVVAENGSTVRALHGGFVTAKSGSTVYAEPGSAVKADAGSSIIPSDVRPF